MLFNSIPFAIFFAVFFVAYAATMKRLALQNLLVLAGSYVFYAWWDPRFVVLVMISSCVNYVAALGAAGERVTKTEIAKVFALMIPIGLACTLPEFSKSTIALAGLFVFLAFLLVSVPLLERFKGEARRKAYLLYAVVFSLVVLGFFKYFNFFGESLTHVLEAVGLAPGWTMLKIILPLGISFHTFQTMSYTIDVYRRDMKPAHSIVDVAGFTAFFPQLIAGPIERGAHLLPQFQKERVITGEAIASGATLFLWGLYQKVVIADNLSPIANKIFSDPAHFSSTEIAAGVVAFTFQIFCDFAGYSLMARGLGRVLGFDLMINFNLPYFSRTPSEFWRRWHISLSSWLRDYLYVPLGGNRKGAFNTYRNLMLTMLLGGLWHGAAWTFVAWGALHGGILVIYRLLDIDRKLKAAGSTTPGAFAIQIFAWAALILLVMAGWIFFRAQTFGQAAEVFAGLFAFTKGPAGLWGTIGFYLWPLLLVHLYQYTHGEQEFVFAAPRPVRFNVVLFIACAVLFLGAQAGQEFIYFDF